MALTDEWRKKIGVGIIKKNIGSTLVCSLNNVIDDETRVTVEFEF